MNAVLARGVKILVFMVVAEMVENLHEEHLKMQEVRKMDQK